MTSHSSPIGNVTGTKDQLSEHDTPRSTSAVGIIGTASKGNITDAKEYTPHSLPENVEADKNSANHDKDTGTANTKKEGSSGSDTDKKVDANQDNVDLIKFSDENYSNLLDHLGHSETQSQNKSTSVAQSKDTHVNDRITGNQHHLELGTISKNGDNLDILLQQYQNVMHKSDDNNNHDKFSSRGTCDFCTQQHKQCVYVPDLGNCIECETKKRKCTFNGSVNQSKRTAELSEMSVENLQRKKSRTSESHKSSHGDIQNEYYSNFLQSLNSSIGQSGNIPNQYDNLSHNGIMNGRDVQRPQSQPVMDQQAKVSVPHHSMSQKVLKKQQQQQQIQYPRSSFYVGPTSIYDIGIVDRIKLDNIDQIQISKTLSLRKVAPKVQFLLSDDYNQKLYTEQEQQIDMVEQLVHPHGKLLVEIFFKRVHPYFPILHERVFLEKYLRSYRELTTPLLACIYSLALQWWDFHPKLIGFAKPDVVEVLNDIAFKTFFERIERPKLSMIQTGLLLLQCRSESKNNWVLCSNVVALSEELGLGVSCQDWKLPKWEKDLRKRLAWAVWSTDKWTALIEGRHSHLILGRNWMVNILKRSEFPSTSPIIQGFGSLDSTGQQQRDGSSFSLNVGNLGLYDMSLTNEAYQDGTLMFQQMVSLSIIVGEIMDTFYTQGAIHVNTNIEQVLKLAKPLQLKLREWYHSLPKQLSMNNFTEKKFNSNATLTLIYFAAEITLHRKIISSLKPNTPKELVQVCRTAARTRLVAAIEFVGDLKSEHINSFWYGCSTGNLMLIGTFAALLYVTAPTKEEAATFRDLMRNYIWVLRVRSKSFDKLRNAFENIHMLLTQIPGLLTDEESTTDRSISFRTPDLSADGKITSNARPPLNITNPISQDILHGLSNLADTSQLNNFGNGTDLDAAGLRDNNFHHGSPSSYASTPIIENELNVNMVQEHRARMNRSNSALLGDNQSPKVGLSNSNSMSPSHGSVYGKPQFSPGKNHQSPSPSMSKPSESPMVAETMDNRSLNNEKRGSKGNGMSPQGKIGPEMTSTKEKHNVP
ncbi:similar to Saccharomyces cerevisiae YIR023W DAL81 Positive regulator of genes in multiple nitrogen degradation pathways [Maudiozyma saulgeensis]|uniref:Similar to Saccharomyces cerevisiae YIR023W DAL81 Positive regulator of genes in multiple nitrogen degradation pathways n=1 Tax=Maudiozyma saulgeensis TaxID=1789683 RepID=A0A1X7RAC7_9SACH|nr:similar to Saccharomyces cerevisiae YIR023W DAL81 Positive regulator of genes in multiple nitrogen degradation pathways [Kazachstania saulgeensis]